MVLPLFVARCSFRRPPLARLQRAVVGCWLLLSTALFVVVVARRPTIVDDVALVLLAASAFVALWSRHDPIALLIVRIQI